MPNNEATTAAATVGQQALMDLAGSLEVADLLAKLQAAQAATEADGSWDTRQGRKVEKAMGYLRMALEAAGRQF